MRAREGRKRLSSHQLDVPERASLQTPVDTEISDDRAIGDMAAGIDYSALNTAAAPDRGPRQDKRMSDCGVTTDTGAIEYDRVIDRACDVTTRADH